VALSDQITVLAYCITEQQSQFDVPSSGVDGEPVRWIDVAALRCFFSNFASPIADQPAPEILTAFNRVLHAIFSHNTIIPFRFPTVVENEGVLRQFLETRSDDYRAALHRLHNKVQMDVRLTLEPIPAPEPPPESGKSYLEHRRARHQEIQLALDKFRCAADSLAESWVQRETPSGARGFALVDRSALPPFLEKIGGVLTPAGISARVTGPWPPSEFVEAAHD
jgi:hypothetical protein